MLERRLSADFFLRWLHTFYLFNETAQPCKCEIKCQVLSLWMRMRPVCVCVCFIQFNMTYAMSHANGRQSRHSRCFSFGYYVASSINFVLIVVASAQPQNSLQTKIVAQQHRTMWPDRCPTTLIESSRSARLNAAKKNNVYFNSNTCAAFYLRTVCEIETVQRSS